MSNLISDSAFVNKESLANIQSSQEDLKDKNAFQENVIALAYYYLVEAAMTSSESALIQAKQTKANGIAQKELNKEAAALPWYYVPDLKEDQHVEYVPVDRNFWDSWWKVWDTHIHVRSWNKVTWVTHQNQLTVSNGQAKNQQVMAERQFLTQKMGVLQQSAYINETHINSINNESMQILQESSQINRILQSLTFKALLRQPSRQ
ncbi:MAG: DUF720 domain-containing protein [Chlamydiales bacterium]